MLADVGGIQEIDDLVEDWTPEPLVAKPTAFEEADIVKRAVIVGSVYLPPRLSRVGC
jgi:serine palmitoyltransferase